MKAIIVGGGIMGLFSAYYLQKEGFEVTILDKGDFTDNCSSGNLGMIVPSHFLPLASPGIVAKGLKWLTDSKSPFYIKPSLSWDLMTWGINFTRHATKKHGEKSAPFIRDYHLLSNELYQELAENKEDFDFFYRHNGILMYYNTENGAEEEIATAKVAKDLGLDVDLLSKESVQELEPALQLDILGAAHYKCDGHLNPTLLNQQLRTYLKSKGVKLLAGTEVKDFEISNAQITKVVCEHQSFTTDVVILSPGSWMKAASKKLGLSIPMMPGKGYTFNEDNSPEMNIPCLLSEARVAITPMGKTIRFGGTMEIGKIDGKINMNRVEGIVDSVNRYFPNIDLSMPKKDAIWFGYRPCSPDGLPYLGYTKKYKNLIVAAGHSMMGLSLAPATGKLVAQLASGKKTEINIDIFKPDRF